MPRSTPNQFSTTTSSSQIVRTVVNAALKIAEPLPTNEIFFVKVAGMSVITHDLAREIDERAQLFGLRVSYTTGAYCYFSVHRKLP